MTQIYFNQEKNEIGFLSNKIDETNIPPAMKFIAEIVGIMGLKCFQTEKSLKAAFHIQVPAGWEYIGEFKEERK